jgi:formylglycine-generating enzyme required for sulfatase activity
MRIDAIPNSHFLRIAAIASLAAAVLSVGRASPANDQKPDALQSVDYQVVTLNAQGLESERRRANSRLFVEQLGDGVTLEMVQIPGGTFVMGASEDEAKIAAAAFEQLGRSKSRSWRRVTAEMPSHRVTVAPFAMGRFEVTQAQWRAVAAMPRVARHLESDPSEFHGDALPVEHVSWYDAVEFCARLSRATGRVYTLPSEAEWEYACRAGTSTPFHFGPTITSLVANFWADTAYGAGWVGETREETMEVGSLGAANAFGLADMHGNVAEWCLDSWHGNYYGAPADGRVWNGKADEHHRVSRGGSYYDHAVNCRSASRIKQSADSTDDDTGFRVVVRGQR